MFLTTLVLCFISLNICVVPSLSARILGVIPTPSYSHQVVFHPLWRELSLRGHQVTVLTTDPLNDPSLTNLTEIDLHFSYKLWNANILDVINKSQGSFSEMFDAFISMINRITDQQLAHPDVQKLIKNESEHFDLLLVEMLYPTMSSFAVRFKCPFIGMTSLEAPITSYEDVGNPTHPVLNPDVGLPFVGELTFFERLTSSLYLVFVQYYINVIVLPLEQLTVQRHFGDDYPLLADITRNVSMLFVNTDQILHQIRPLVPAVVQIGSGTHLRPPQPLPQDLQNILDDAANGFIYFSLGTNVKSKDLSTERLGVLLEAFGELPYTVLWKFELEDMPGKPDNVFLSKWFPQQDVFRHPNIKLFITQGGQQSMEEAILSHVPIVGIPFFGDQLSNVKRVVSKGIGLSLEHTSIEKSNFQAVILEVINNPKYRNRVKELAELAQDQPMTGLERAVWWTEYVLRHKGAKHLRSSVMDLPLYQYFLLDVIGFSVFVLLVVVCLVMLLIKSVLYLLKKLMKCFIRSESKVKVQ